MLTMTLPLLNVENVEKSSHRNVMLMFYPSLPQICHLHHQSRQTLVFFVSSRVHETYLGYAADITLRICRRTTQKSYSPCLISKPHIIHPTNSPLSKTIRTSPTRTETHSFWGTGTGAKAFKNHNRASKTLSALSAIQTSSRRMYITQTGWPSMLLWEAVKKTRRKMENGPTSMPGGLRRRLTYLYRSLTAPRAPAPITIWEGTYTIAH